MRKHLGSSLVSAVSCSSDTASFMYVALATGLLRPLFSVVFAPYSVPKAQRYFQNREALGGGCKEAKIQTAAPPSLHGAASSMPLAPPAHLSLTDLQKLGFLQ